MWHHHCQWRWRPRLGETSRCLCRMCGPIIAIIILIRWVIIMRNMMTMKKIRMMRLTIHRSCNSCVTLNNIQWTWWFWEGHDYETGYDDFDHENYVDSDSKEKSSKSEFKKFAFQFFFDSWEFPIPVCIDWAIYTENVWEVLKIHVNIFVWLFSTVRL